MNSDQLHQNYDEGEVLRGMCCFCITPVSSKIRKKRLVWRSKCCVAYEMYANSKHPPNTQLQPNTDTQKF